jgi:glutamate synthase (NADPH) large chain
MSARARAVPMILATSAVHSHLVRQGLRAFSSITVRSGECLDVHYFAVLIGVGATTVNAYLAEAAIADRHARGLFGASRSPSASPASRRRSTRGCSRSCPRWASRSSAPIAAAQLRGRGPLALVCREYFPGLTSPHLRHRPHRHQEQGPGAARAAFDEAEPPLAIGGFYRYRRGGEQHGYEAG